LQVGRNGIREPWRDQSSTAAAIIVSYFMLWRSFDELFVSGRLSSAKPSARLGGDGSTRAPSIAPWRVRMPPRGDRQGA